MNDGDKTIDGMSTVARDKYIHAKASAINTQKELDAERERIRKWQQEHPILHVISQNKAIAGGGVASTLAAGFLGYQQLHDTKQAPPPPPPVEQHAVTVQGNVATEVRLSILEHDLKALKEQVSAMQRILFTKKR